ncbi:hypothetical protein EDL98_06305 [Ornithobacterium rhinotracheale]|uniref:hypothetical protein n=1 Tax=Ornithobacterium rhinotracheale TaxID=28251 RepID=UPI00129C1470|nr:hypothetical protein [Ornithobacterium rhinotracheale]MRJ10694.1 hypothetical protein [Ornithobacterium rhinotracheale]
MKKLFISLGLIASTMMFAQENQIPLKNLVKFSRICLNYDNDFRPCIDVKEGDIIYTLVFDQTSSKPVDINKTINIYIKSTRSPNFKTPEGITLENTYNDVKKYGKLVKTAGFGNYVELPSGWRANFYNKENSFETHDNEKIVSFSKVYKK